ncbi:MAG: hypothetical protein E6583_02285 [Clostridium sp.]|nr:hypothetical protein [Clostridium sp.]
MSKGKKLETEVVLCVGNTDIFEQVLFTFTEGSLPFFIEDVNAKLQNIDLNVAMGKCCDTVIFSAELFLNVIYKVRGTVTTDATTGIVTSDDVVRHQTKLVPISGCIPMDCEKFKKCDKNVYAKLLDVCITESHILTNPVDATEALPEYNNLREQVCIKIKAKVVTDEIITINFDDEDDKEKKC